MRSLRSSERGLKSFPVASKGQNELLSLRSSERGLKSYKKID